MTGQESFEDRFDHDPNAVYEDEEDEDLGPDDEFADEHAQKKTSSPKKQPPAHLRVRNLEPPKTGGFVGMIFQIFLSLCVIAACYFYFCRPEDFGKVKEKAAEIKEKITEMLPFEKNGEEAPLPSLKKPEAPVTEKNEKIVEKPAEKHSALREEESDGKTTIGTRMLSVVTAPSAPVGKTDKIVLYGSGMLPNFSDSLQKRPSLKAHLTAAEQITFETLNTHHELVKNMIAEWAGETDEEKIAEIVEMPYTQFFYKTSAALLAQTLLKGVGLATVTSERTIVQSPIHIMAAVYPPLKEAMAGKPNIQEQIRTFEPVSSFLIYACHDDPECMASWDLLIDMLNIKQFSKRLEKAPETIYTRQ